MEAASATVAAAKPAVETSGELLMLMKGQMDELERHTATPEPVAAETQQVDEPANETIVRTLVAPKPVERADSEPIIIDKPDEAAVFADQAAAKPPAVMVEVPDATVEVPAAHEEPIRIQVAEPTIREVLQAEAPEPVFAPEPLEYPAEAGFDAVADTVYYADTPVQEHDVIVSEDIFLEDVPDAIVLGEAVPEERIPESVIDLNEAFDDEVMETFERLRELVDLAGGREEGETVPSAGADSADLPESEWAADLKAETPRSVQPEAFEELVMVEAEAGEKPGDIEELTSDAAGRPLEETFARLALYLVESDEAVHDPDSAAPHAPQAAETAQAIEEALRSVAELLLPASAAAELADKDEKSEEKPRVTPELTLKLLTLLRAVGYDRPEEVLLELIRRHSFEFLAQAVRYLYRLCDDDNRWELARSTRSLIIPEPALPLTTRLGKSIIALLTVPQVPETAVAAMGD